MGIVNSVVLNYTQAIEYYEWLGSYQKYLYFKQKLKYLWNKKAIIHIMNSQVTILDASMDEEEQLQDQHLDQLQRIHENMKDEHQLVSFIEENKVNASSQAAFKKVMKHKEVNHARDIIQEKIKMRIEYLIKKKNIKAEMSRSSLKHQRSRSKVDSLIETSTFQ